jgi:hypothetical protein
MSFAPLQPNLPHAGQSTRPRRPGLPAWCRPAGQSFQSFSEQYIHGEERFSLKPLINGGFHFRFNINGHAFTARQYMEACRRDNGPHSKGSARSISMRTTHAA